MRVKITAPFDYVTTRAKNGLALASVAYTPTKAPVTVPQAHGEAGVAAGKMVEVKEVAKRADADK